MQTIRKYQSWLFLFFVFCFLLYINIYTPLNLGDDYIYQYIFEHGNLFAPLPSEAVKISSWGDLLYSLKLHYLNWHGRLTNHFMFLSLLYIGKPYSDIIIAFMSIVLFVVVYWVSDYGEISFQFKIKRLYIIVFLFWLFLINWGSVFTWIGGATNYLFTSVFVLLFLLPYIRYYFSKPVFSEKYMNVIMCAGGLISGCTNENSVPVVLLFIGIYLFKNFKTVPLWMKIGFISMLFGFAIFITAPGNYNRILCELQNAEGHYLYELQFKSSSFSEGYNIVKRVNEELRNGALFPWINWNYIRLNFSNLYSIIVVDILLNYYILHSGSLIVKSKKKFDVKLFYLASCFWIAGVLSVLMLLFSPYIVFRSSFFSLVFFVISIMMISKILQDNKIEILSKFERKIIIIFCVVYSIYFIPAMIYNVSVSWNQYQNFIDFVKTHPNQEIVIEIPKNKNRFPYVHNIDFFISDGPKELKRDEYYKYLYSGFIKYYNIKNLVIADSDNDKMLIYSK